MQEMTGGVCNQAEVGDSKQLIDERDDKLYWITKLKDNNCWMTQNLDLDLSIYDTLTPEDTDLSADWTPSASTQIAASPSFTTATNDVQSWDPAQGKTATYCNDGGVVGKCKMSGNSTTSMNNGHDAQGNYYSWGAATAGQAATLTSSTAGEQSTQSICPKGWKLPAGGNNTGQFYSLLNGLTVAQITASPYYFVYGGYVNSSSLDYAGSYGFYWSSTASHTTYAYNLRFDTSVYPSDSQRRYNGYSVRCVAK